MLLRRHRAAREGRQTTSETALPQDSGDGKSYADMKKPELVAECKARDLPHTGKVAELRERLAAADAEPAPDGEAGGVPQDSGENGAPDTDEGDGTEPDEDEGSEEDADPESEGDES